MKRASGRLSRRIWIVQVVGGCVGLDGLPTATSVQFHPVIFAILHFARVFQCLGEEVPKEVVVRSILKSQIAHVAEVFIEFLCLPMLA